MSARRYPYYLANVAQAPNADLEVIDKYRGTLAARVALPNAPPSSRPLPLRAGEILAAFEQAPAGLLEHRLVAILGHAPGLGGAPIVDGQIHLGDDMEAVEDIQGAVQCWAISFR